MGGSPPCKALLRRTPRLIVPGVPRACCRFRSWSLTWHGLSGACSHSGKPSRALRLTCRWPLSRHDEQWLVVHHYGSYDAPMTTTNPRLTITLRPSVSAQIRELSRLTKNSQSGVISELLESSSPVFERLIQVLSAAETAKAELSGQVRRDLDAAQSRVEKQLGLILEDFGDVTKPILDKAEGIKRRARRAARVDAKAPPRRASGASLTPISNRGVRLDKNTTNNIAANKDKVRPKSKKTGVKIRGGE